MSGHRRWEDIRVHVTRADPDGPVAAQPPFCRECGRRVRRWQSYGGWRPIGFTVKTADVVWHMKCLRDDA